MGAVECSRDSVPRSLPRGRGLEPDPEARRLGPEALSPAPPSGSGYAWTPPSSGSSTTCSGPPLTADWRTPASYLWATDGKLNGRAPAAKAIESKYLLTGFAQCALCGGSMMARSRDYGSRRRYSYLCGYHHQRGRTVCVNGLESPMDTTDHA